MEYVTFNNGVQMPILGYGTFQTPPAVTAQNVTNAINLGYRSIDTAQVYGTEPGVGTAIANSGLARDQFFVTTKTQTDGYEATAHGLDESLQRLGGDYFDLVLIHWPTTHRLETYRALEDAYQAGKVRAIGLSNFNPKQLDDLLANSHVKPVIDQVETHLFWQQAKLRPYLDAHDIIHESWAPLGENFGPEMMALPAVTTIAQAHGVTPAQVLLRWLTQQGIVTIPKSTNVDHLATNLASLDFDLTPAEIASLRQFDRHHSIKDWPQSMREDRY
ncbi:aldo/keto reductase [Levilactobacillus suantsaiihabitans]|uniref:Aldo/keto reductase n=1 Tax=Levilactobacillus suantsaiihabitans TaxID=2487722 RepID=A0A4Z0JCB2_9LACO|nr:aldo/keto reductase [Levilactobacillus suantsaiihabitans]TGD20471.1 aldo/keto reductase [Levilactobacillus suantsaiihabitans]